MVKICVHERYTIIHCVDVLAFVYAAEWPLSRASFIVHWRFAWFVMVFFQFYLSFVPFNLCVALSSSRAVLRTILIKKNYDDDDIQHNIIFKMVSQAKLHAQFTIAGQLKVN